MKKLRKPDGGQFSPARTCREIAANSEAELKNGDYWVDPNGGGVADAIKVFCRFDQKELDKTQTCLIPQTDSFKRDNWFRARPSGDEIALFADSFADSEFGYGTHKSQVKYLQHLTRQAKQKIAIKCKNVVAVYDKQNSSYSSAVKLISFDEEEMHIHSKKAFRYKVVEDGCQERNGEWSKTVLEVKAKEGRVKRLPILDIGFKDVAGTNQKFGIEIGKACFFS